MEMNENLIKLIKILNSDLEKAREFSSKKSEKELYNYCISLVPGYSEEEFAEFMKNLSESLKNRSNESKISEDDLEHISGGTDMYQTIVSFLNAFQEGKEEGNKILSKINSMKF